MKYLLVSILLAGCSSTEPHGGTKITENCSTLETMNGFAIRRCEYPDAVCFVYSGRSISCVPKSKGTDSQ